MSDEIDNKKENINRIENHPLAVSGPQPDRVPIAVTFVRDSGGKAEFVVKKEEA